jgi:hypothetical protein
VQAGNWLTNEEAEKLINTPVLRWQQEEIPVLKAIHDQAVLAVMIGTGLRRAEGAGLVQAMLEAAPEVKLVVTSRERLQLRAEWVVAVEGLPFAETQPGDAKQHDALRLFAACARQSQAGFVLSGEEETAAFSAG